MEENDEFNCSICSVSLCESLQLALSCIMTEQKWETEILLHLLYSVLNISSKSFPVSNSLKVVLGKYYLVARKILIIFYSFLCPGIRYVFLCRIPVIEGQKTPLSWIEDKLCPHDNNVP